jgi:hypothetical protein
MEGRGGGEAQWVPDPPKIIEFVLSVYSRASVVKRHQSSFVLGVDVSAMLEQQLNDSSPENKTSLANRRLNIESNF